MNTVKQTSAAGAGLTDDELGGNLRALKKWTLVSKISMTAAIPVAFALLVIFSVNEMIGAGFVSAAAEFVLAVGIGLYAGQKVKTLKDFMGNNLTLPILRQVFEVKDYIPNGHISAALVASAGLMDDWNRIAGSDFIEGTYRGINLQYSDLHLERVEEERDEDGKKKKRYITVFKGQWLICDFGKELAANLRLFERKSGTKWNIAHDVSKSSVETENIEFNKKFRIITSDGHTAFYLLTPHFMERLLAADEMAKASSFFCFKDGKVHIALYSGRNSFEVQGVKLGDMDNVRRKFRGDLRHMTDFMDELLQNDRLFKEA